jgi:hypothetical protein
LLAGCTPQGLRQRFPQDEDMGTQERGLHGACRRTLRLLLRYMTLKYSDCGAVDPAEGCADVATFLCGVNPFTERGPCFDRFDGGGWRNVLRGIVAAEDVDPARTLVTTANGTLDGVSPIPPLSPSMLTSSSTRGCREAPATVLPMMVLPALAPVPARETAPLATTRVGGLNLEGALDLRILCAPTSQTQNLLVLASGGSGVCLCVCSCVCGVDSALHRLGVDQDATIALQSLRDDPRDARRNATVLEYALRSLLYQYDYCLRGRVVNARGSIDELPWSTHTHTHTHTQTLSYSRTRPHAHSPTHTHSHTTLVLTRSQ